jgi:hypothetical protein
MTTSTPSDANSRQVAGTHYKSGIQHWDYVVANNLDYFQGQITKYVTRWKQKNGIQDLKKAQHFLEKYIQVEEAKLNPIHAALDGDADSRYVNQDPSSFFKDGPVKRSR